ncbi:hypothetical protein WA026_016648 [Henosepilachna vigintioctopunctata]|uniref:Uncharacterized protein n=1 Tax=Henosepilachna vigintioctopunctata TaxID=420089 RepID=A0AAW1VES1_9CUCU
MLATLIHSTLSVESQDDGRKMYLNLMKKLKKEVGERQNASLQHIRQLLPITRSVTEIIAVEPIGSLTDGKGNKISFDSIDEKHDFQVTDKQRRPASYYLDPPPLPPEDLEPLQDKPDSNLKADTPSSVDQSPITLGKGRGKGQRKPRKPKSVPGPMQVNPMVVMAQNIPQQSGMHVAVPGGNQQMGHNMGYGQGMPPQGQQYGGNPNQQQWYNAQQQQPGYYGAQTMQSARFERPPINQSKQALSNMLRQRLPHNQFMSPGRTGPGPNPAGPGAYPAMQRFPRQPIRQPHPGAMQSNQAALFSQQYGNMQNTVNQPYGNYPTNNMMANNMPNNQQVMQGGSSEMFPGQQQAFAGQQRPQPDYRGMSQNPRQQYIQQQMFQMLP